MSTNSRSTVYGLRIDRVELEALQKQAKKRGVRLSQALREGAKLYLDSPDGPAHTAVNDLEAAVEKAQAVLRAAKEE